jgi:hypothetical protein
MITLKALFNLKRSFIMVPRQKNNFFFLSLMIFASIMITGCEKKQTDPTTQNKLYSLFSKINQDIQTAEQRVPQNQFIQPTQPITPTYTEPAIASAPTPQELSDELDFTLLNNTGKRIYVACFSYIQKHYTTRWRWDKSPVYKLEPLERITINIDTIENPDIRNKIHGYLGVFDNQKDAENSIYELLPDNKKTDLDLLWNIKGKTIVVGTEKYGFKKDILDVHLINNQPLKAHQDIDFVVKNNTGKPKIIAGFVYQNQNTIQDIWRFDKTNLLTLHPGEKGWIDVDTVMQKKNRSHARGFLGVFDIDQKRFAENITYELLPPKNKIKLGQLSLLKNKMVSIEDEQYGIEGNLIDYSIKPTRPIFAQNQQPISSSIQSAPAYSSQPVGSTNTQMPYYPQPTETQSHHRPNEAYSYAVTATITQPTPPQIEPHYQQPSQQAINHYQSTPPQQYPVTSQPQQAYSYAPTTTQHTYYQPQPTPNYAYTTSMTAEQPRFQQITYQQPETARFSATPAVQTAQRTNQQDKKKKKPFYRLFF